MVSVLSGTGPIMSSGINLSKREPKLARRLMNLGIFRFPLKSISTNSVEKWLQFLVKML